MRPSSPLSARDKGFALVSRLNRWLIAGAVGLSGVLSVAAANAFHGRTRGQSATSAQATSVVRHHSSSGGGTVSNSGSDGLKSPARAPAPASAPSAGGVVSGGS